MSKQNKSGPLRSLGALVLLIVSMVLMAHTDRLVSALSRPLTGRVLSVSGEQAYAIRIGGKIHRERVSSRYWVSLSVDSFPGTIASFYVENPHTAEAWRGLQGTQMPVSLPRESRIGLGIEVNGLLWYVVPLAALGLAIFGLFVTGCVITSNITD